MKKFKRTILYFVLVLAILACQRDDSAGCFEEAGKTISYDVQASAFKGISISEGIELVIKEGPEYKVTVSTGENIRAGISASIQDSTLFINNSGGCNWVRDYNTTTVYITTPRLEKIYSASQFNVLSDGVLNFPSLLLQSGITGETASGVFELSVNCRNLVIEDNQALYSKISGTTENLTVNFYSGDARFDGRNLIVQRATIFHRSSNDIIINARQAVKGTVYSTGNLLLKGQPELVDVQELYTGRVIYK